MFRIHLPWLIGLVCLLSACAGYAPTGSAPGQDRNSVVARMGPPSLALQSAGGTTLVYARGPLGKHTYFVMLDAQDRVLRWEQRLSETYFTQVQPGMTAQDVLALIGPSREITLLGRGRGEVWSYRYENPFCQWFRVEFSADKTVRGSGYGEPPECENRRRFPWLLP